MPKRSLADMDEAQRFDLLRTGRLLRAALGGARRVPVESLLDMFVAAGAQDRGRFMQRKGLGIRPEEFATEGIVVVQFGEEVTDAFVTAHLRKHFLADATIPTLLAFIARDRAALRDGAVAARGTVFLERVRGVEERFTAIGTMDKDVAVVQQGNYSADPNESWRPGWRFLARRLS